MEQRRRTAQSPPQSEALMMSFAGNHLLKEKIAGEVALIHFRPHLEVSDVIPEERISHQELDKLLKEKELLPDQARSFIPESFGPDITLANQQLTQLELGAEPVTVLLAQATQLIDQEIADAEGQLVREDSPGDEIELQDSIARLNDLKKEVGEFKQSLGPTGILGKAALGAALSMASYLLRRTRVVVGKNEAVIAQAIAHSSVDVLGLAFAGAIIPFTGDEPALNRPADPVSAKLIAYGNDFKLIFSVVNSGGIIGLEQMMPYEQYLQEVGDIYLDDISAQYPGAAQEERIRLAEEAVRKHYQEIQSAIDAILAGQMTLGEAYDLFFSAPADKAMGVKKPDKGGEDKNQYTAVRMQEVARATETKKLLKEGEKLVASGQGIDIAAFLTTTMTPAFIRQAKDIAAATARDKLAQEEVQILARPATPRQQSMDELIVKLDSLSHNRSQSLAIGAN